MVLVVRAVWMARVFTCFIRRSSKRRYAMNLAKDGLGMRLRFAAALLKSIERGGERAEEEVVVHLGSNVTELVRQCLQAAAVVINGLFILVTVKKFLLQKNAALKLVVGEEAVQLDPQGAGGVADAHDRVEQVLEDGGQEPPDDRGVDRGPLGVIHHGAGVHIAIHVVHEIVLAEEQ